MKFQLVLAACLLAAAFAAPVPEYIDPDCLEEEFEAAEPAEELDAEFALGQPDIVIDFGESESDECEDDVVPTEAEPTTEAECEDDPIPTMPPTQPPAPQKAVEATDECVDEPIPTEPVPTEAPTVAPETEAECEDEPIPTEPVPEPVVTELGDDCEEEDGAYVENEPILNNIVVEPAMVEQEPVFIGGESEFPDIEECEEY